MLRPDDCERNEVDVERVVTGIEVGEDSGCEAVAIPTAKEAGDISPSGKLSFALNPLNLIAAVS